MTPVQVERPRVSYSELERWPEDGRRYELYDGEVWVVPSPLPLHQRVLLTLEDFFRRYAEEHGGEALIAPLDIVFSEYDVVQPDLVFFQRARRHLVRPDSPIRHAPDIVIEVLSPSTAAVDRGRKQQMFARFGVREYWIVDPRSQVVEVFWLQGDAYLQAGRAAGTDVVESAVLPDLSIPVPALFERAFD
jgi:Uma2 family endonuclease